MSQTLIGGTAYTIDHGNTLIGGTDYTIDHGKTLVGGTSYDIELAAAASGPYSLSDWPGWSNATWEDINNLCYAKQQGYIDSWPSDVVLGATKVVGLSDSVLGYSGYQVEIIDVDKDAPGTITFCSTHVSTTATAFYADAASLGSSYYPNYSSSDLFNICTTFYNNMLIKSYVKQITKRTGTDGVGNNGPVNNTKNLVGVWVLSRPEVGLATPTTYFNDLTDVTMLGVNDHVTTPYARFANNPDSRKKGKYNSSTKRAWWLRSLPMDATSNKQVATVQTSGNLGKSTCSTSNYFVPAFCIGNPSAQTIE